MDILGGAVGLDQPLVPGHMGQNPQLDLGIVRVNEHAALRRHKYLADLPPQLHAHRDILQVRFCATDSTGGRDGLVKFPVNPSIGANVSGQPLRIGGVQLGQLAVIQNLSHHRVVVRQLFQHVRSSGIAGLGLFASRKLHLPEQDLSQLLGGVNIKPLSGFLIDLCLHLVDLHLQAAAIIL